MDPRAPLKIKLEAPAAISIAKPVLQRKDAIAPEAEVPRWETSFQAGAAGPAEIKAHFKFFLCRETICESRTTTLSVPVAVK